MAKGSLLDVIYDESEVFTFSSMLGYMLDAAQGMDYLHTKQILHLDLKSPNLLVDEHMRVKVADFGICKISSEDEKNTKSISYGTWYTCAPEMWLRRDASKAADSFSFGIVMSEILAREVPYLRKMRALSLDLPKIMKRIVHMGERPELREDLPSDLVDLAKQCWHNEPSKRPMFSEITERLRGFTTRKWDQRYTPVMF